MSEIPLCSIVISSQIPVDEIESLETSLSLLSSVNVQKSSKRIVGADDILFVLAVIGGIDATSNLISKIVKVLKDWRRKVRDKGEEPKVRLEHPKRPFLDLNTATDEEIEEWLSQK